MVEGYIEKDKRKKILLLSDDIRMHSGVATMSKEIVVGTAHKYNWFQLGAALKHPEVGKIIDVSDDVNKAVNITDADVKVMPTEGYGNPPIIRALLKNEKPDAIFIFTDPRYWIWLFEIEREIRNKIPIVWLNIWDDYPAPMYNKNFYNSVDCLMGISKQTVNINRIVLGDKAKNKITKYIPHGLNPNIYKPLDDVSEFRKKLFQGDEVDFSLFFNSRNIRRKQIPDTMWAFKMFLDGLPKEKADKCRFILHTEVTHQAGTDLIAIKELLFEDYPNALIFSTSKLPNEDLNKMYNSTDCQILLTSNEGWGLTLTEAMLAGNPIIANTTGGMQDQMRFEDENGKWFTPSPEVPSNNTGKYKKHGEWAFPVYPTSRSIQGSPVTPYIWDDRCKAEDAADRIREVYDLGREKRKEIGAKAREWCLSEEAGFTSQHQGKRVIEAIDELFNTWEPREVFEVIDTDEDLSQNRIQTHNLVY